MVCAAPNPMGQATKFKFLLMNNTKNSMFKLPGSNCVYFFTINVDYRAHIKTVSYN